MQTFKRFELGQEEIPAAIGWYLADLGETRGKQELFRRQSPQTLKALREHAMIESAVSSNRIEGVVVDQARVRAVVLGKSHLRDRNEEEIRGYRNALKLIHESRDRMKVSIRLFGSSIGWRAAELVTRGDTSRKTATSSSVIRTGQFACVSRPSRQPILLES